VNSTAGFYGGVTKRSIKMFKILPFLFKSYLGVQKYEVEFEKF